MNFNVRVLRRAADDIAEIGRYVARDAPEAAERLLDEPLSAMDSLEQLPRRGAAVRDERLRRLGYRFLVVREYLILYKVLRTQVRIYRVIHGQRRYRTLL